jgi:hypothetical protein
MTLRADRLEGLQQEALETASRAVSTAAPAWRASASGDSASTVAFTISGIVGRE